MEANEQKQFMQLEADIVKALKQIFDPEIPVNIYDLGLIYEINVDADNNVDLKMTLTAPNCPIADSLVQEVNDQVKKTKGVNQVNVQLVFDPPWNKDMMSEEALLELGFL